MKPGMGWPIGVGVILGATVVLNLVVMRVANSDPSFAIEPDYYRRAVQFDSTMASERRNVALHWSATAMMTEGHDGTDRLLTVTLLDRAGQPVRGATVHVGALFNARANDVRSATLVEAAPGRYNGHIAVTYAGQWEVRVDAVRGADRFTASTRTDVR